MKLFLDENLSPDYAGFLRDKGHDALGALEAGLSGAADPIIRAFAIREGRILVTLDADFADLTRYPTAGTPGVIRLKIQVPTKETVREELSRALWSLQNIDLRDCIAVCHRGAVRIRRQAQA